MSILNIGIKDDFELFCRFLILPDLVVFKVVFGTAVFVVVDLASLVVSITDDTVLSIVSAEVVEKGVVGVCFVVDFVTSEVVWDVVVGGVILVAFVTSVVLIKMDVVVGIFGVKVEGVNALVDTSIN